MKKKFYYAGMLAAGLLTFASCNNDDDPIIDQNQVQTEEEAGQVIRIAVANTGDGLTTRAGRPLFSSEAKQEIDRVTAYILNSDGTIVADTTIVNWTSDAVSEVYTTGGHGRQAIWKLSGANRLSMNGAPYSVYAVGYTSNGSLYEDYIEDFLDLKQVSEDDVITYKTFSKFLAGPLTIKNDLGEEIFAGALTGLDLDDEGSFDVSADPEANVLTLHRQVAGTMGYFTSIPTLPVGQYVDMEDGKIKGEGIKDESAVVYGIESAKDLKLQLVSSSISNKIIFDNFNSDFTEANEDNSNAWFVVNGVARGGDTYITTPTAKFSDVNNNATGYILYTINLKDWFPNGDVNKDGLLDAADAEDLNNWNTPSTVQGASFVPGSVFAGKFLIPFAKKNSLNTLQLQLVKISNNSVVRTWDINLPNDDRQVYPTEGHAIVWNGEEGETASIFSSLESVTGVEGETTNSYSMVRNHLYSIGVKNTDVEGPDDEPEVLSKGQRITLRVNDNWEMIHHMVVD